MKEKNVEELDLIIVIEEFTKWAFGFLRIQPEHIQNIFNEMIKFGLETKDNT